MRHRFLALMLGATAAAMALAAPAADIPAKTPARTPCFRSQDWSGWKATPDARSLYIGVGGNRIYRLDMASACPALNQIGVHLVTRTRGSGWICHALDVDLKVSDGRAFMSACIVNGLTVLSADEAAALPKALRP